MSTTSASVNPNSSTFLGKFPAIFRDDNASYYEPDATANDHTAITIIDNVTSTLPEVCILMMVCTDADWLGAGIYLYSAGVLTELFDSGSKFGVADTDSMLNIYISSSDLLYRNRTDQALAAGAVRIYRLA